MRCLALVPAFEAASTVGAVVSELVLLWPKQHGLPAVLVVDDGSSDTTKEVARRAGAEVLALGAHRGKGAALAAGFRRARELGADAVVTVDADGQHPATEALRVLGCPAPERALVLGVRDLTTAGAPRANRFSNAFSNFFVSRFGGAPFHDTQCGLRRYPLDEVLALGTRSTGFAFESELLVRAARAGLCIEELPIRVIYDRERRSHFRVVRDPTRIVLRLLLTTVTARRARGPRADSPRAGREGGGRAP